MLAPLYIMHEYMSNVFDAFHSANAEVLSFCQFAEPAIHPDLFEHFYQLAEGCQHECRGMAYESPVLFHPHNGIIFAFALSMSEIVIRLPQAMCDDMLTDPLVTKFDAQCYKWRSKKKKIEPSFMQHWVSVDAWRSLPARISNLYQIASGYAELLTEE